MTCGCFERWTRPVAPVAAFSGGVMSRRQALRAMGAALSVAAAGCGAVVTAAHRDAARQLADETISVDLHSHPGMFTSSPLTMDGQVERMARGKLRASLFCSVADGPVIGRRPGGLYATREPRPGELMAYTQRLLAMVETRVASGALLPVRMPSDLEVVRTRGVPGAILAIEGGDFLEGRIERVQAAYERGVRSIQLTHYRINELGDIQTDPPRHGGLTPFGLDVVREMNRLGMVVDVAHLTLPGVRAAVEVSRKPLLLSHTVLGSGWARSVTREHARLVASRGGLIGIFPVNSGYQGFAGYIEHIVQMVEAVGPDHVGIGTDMDGISPPSFVSYDDYGEWPSIGAALLARGRSREDVAKVMGGNFLRLFREVAAA
jgi:membrane dipeptidase